MAARPLAQPPKQARTVLGSVTPRPPSSGVAQRLSSRAVTFLKVTLPLIALVLLGLVLAWPRLNPDPREFRLGAGNISATIDADASRMIKPRYVGLDENNQPYAVVADTAIQAAGSADNILLAKPKADVTLKDGSWVAVDAREGLYDRVRQFTSSTTPATSSTPSQPISTCRPAPPRETCRWRAKAPSAI